MAAFGFQVHTDKENATPGIIRPLGKQSVQAFPSKGTSKLTQPTPRKALGSVNNQVPHVSSSLGLKGRAVDAHLGPVNALFKSKTSVGDENLSAGHFTKKSKAKSSPIASGLKKPSVRARTSKPVVKSKPLLDPIPVVPDDVEYDSDTILPHSDRLSCYVEKLFTWRPPCLFGTIPDSDSDIEDVADGDFSYIGDIDPPSFSLFEADDQDLPQNLSELLVDLPSLSPPHYDSVSTPAISPDLLPLNDQSLDSSLHLGHLQFGSVTQVPGLTSESVKDDYSNSHSAFHADL